MPSQQPKRHDPLHSVRSGAKAFGTAQSTRARRAVQEMEKDKRGWIRHGIAAVAIAGLGLAAAGAVAVTGHANETADHAPSVSISSSAAGLTGGAYSSRNGDTSSRSANRPDLNGADLNGAEQGVGTPLDGTVDLSALRDAQKNAKVTDTSQSNDDATKAAAARAKALKSDATKTQELSGKLSKADRAQKMKDAQAGVASQDTTSTSSNNVASTDTGNAPDYGSAGTVDSSGSAALPVAKGAYHIAATFGQYGSWSRWHTGVDFAAPIGTPIHAPGSGTITNAGYGPASGWAGNYVVVKFANGDQMLMAHMSSVSVSVGQQVTVGQIIGHVGQTGRAFGPHTHVEFYPRGITPGDVYRAVDPVKNYFAPHGLSI